MVYSTAKIGRIDKAMEERAFESGISVSELLVKANLTKSVNEEVRLDNGNIVELDDLVENNGTYFIVPSKVSINGSQ